MLVSMHDHSHDHHHGHSLNITQVNKSLIAGILLNIVFVLVEFAAGFFSGSLALISDAGHNLSDVASLALALLAFRLLKSKSTEKYTYGYRKASILIVINFVSALLFFRDREKDLNLKGAYLHLMVDALVSVGVVFSGIIMMFTQWFWIDPLISLIIMVVILTSTWNLLRDSLSLSMD